MLLNADYIDPAELTGYARAALADMEANQFTLSRWLPSRLVPDLDYRFTRGGGGLVEAATFRAWDAESPIGSRPGLARVSGELPPISRKIRLGEYDRLRLRGAEDSTVLSAIYADAVTMTRSVGARIELARGTALYSGALAINENGIIATVNFGRVGTHTVAPAILWTTFATAVPLTDLIAWRDLYVTTNGVAPGAILTSSTVVGYLLRNAEIRQLGATVAGTPTLVSRAALNEILLAYDLPPIYTYDAQVSVGGVTTRVIPADRLIYLPAPDPDPATNELGATLYGITAEALEWDDIEPGEEPGVVAAVYKDPDPVSIWTKAGGIGLPIVAAPDLTLTADVA